MDSSWLNQFVIDGTISHDQLIKVEKIAKLRQIATDQAMIDLGHIDEWRLMQAKAKAFGLQVIDLESIDIPQSVLEQIPECFVHADVCIPVDFKNDLLTVVVFDPDPADQDLLERLPFLLGRNVEFVVGRKELILAAIDKHYPQCECVTIGLPADFVDESEVDVDVTGDRSPIEMLVNLIISEAVIMNATDIHIEPFEDRVRIRYRINGDLMERDTLPGRQKSPLTNQLKRLGQIDVKEKTQVQEGHLTTQVNGKDYNLSVSMLPTNYGQAIAMHFLSEVCE